MTAIVNIRNYHVLMDFRKLRDTDAKAVQYHFFSKHYYICPKIIVTSHYHAFLCIPRINVNGKSYRIPYTQWTAVMPTNRASHGQLTNSDILKKRGTCGMPLASFV